MANERIHQSPEHRLDTKELESAGLERSKELERKHEVAAEKERSPETSAENARHEIENIKQEKQEREQPATHERAPDKPLNNAKTRNASYKHTMGHIQSQMPAASRAFSKVLHAPAVEKASEVAGATVARPNAILSGAVFASLLTLAVYLIARWYGYPLSGFETIGTFLLGWIIGNVYDFLKVMITGKKA